MIFIFSFDLHTDIILKQFNKRKNTYIYFHFPLLFPVLFPPLCFPIVVPVVLPRCTTPLLVEVLEPTVAKTDDLGLVPIFIKIDQKKCVIFIFSFDLHTDIILKQFNK